MLYIYPPQAAYSPRVAFVIFVRFCSKLFSFRDASICLRICICSGIKAFLVIA